MDYFKKPKTLEVAETEGGAGQKKEAQNRAVAQSSLRPFKKVQFFIFSHV